MKRMYTRLTLAFMSVIMLVTLSGCARKEGGQLISDNPIGNNFWDTVFVKPLAMLINFITENTGSFALAVVLTTIVVRTILFPIYTKSNDTSSKMQAVQPQIKKIQAKYAGKTDPESRQRQQLELMQVYKDNNINMLAGCLMPFLQMPVFMAMYHSVARTPITYGYELGETKFLWLNRVQGDFSGLALADHLYILPIIVAITAVVLQYISMYGLSPEAKNNPTMKAMMYIMPGMMFIFSMSNPAALGLYWIAGNIYSTLQIVFVKKPFKKDK
jgi:YidC/Oxa1 family membrane protein insertase